MMSFKNSYITAIVAFAFFFIELLLVTLKYFLRVGNRVRIINIYKL